MDDKSREYIDAKFDKMFNTLKWAGGILVTVLIAFSTAISLNIKTAYANKQAIEKLQVQQSDLRYLMVWSLELAETNRDLMKAIVEDEDISAIIDKLSDIERRIYGANGMPTYRGNQPMKKIEP